MFVLWSYVYSFIYSFVFTCQFTYLIHYSLLVIRFQSFIYVFIFIIYIRVIGGYQKVVEAFSLKQTIATINSYKEHSLKNVTSPEKNVPHVTSPEKNIPEVSATSTSPAQNVPHSRSSITDNVLHSSLITKHVPFSPSCTYFQSDCAVTSTYEALVAYRWNLIVDLGSRQLLAFFFDYFVYVNYVCYFIHSLMYSIIMVSFSSLLFHPFILSIF